MSNYLQNNSLLPHNVWHEIGYYLDLPDLLNMLRVSKQHFSYYQSWEFKKQWASLHPLENLRPLLAVSKSSYQRIMKIWLKHFGSHLASFGWSRNPFSAQQLEQECAHLSQVLVLDLRDRENINFSSLQKILKNCTQVKKLYLEAMPMVDKDVDHEGINYPTSLTKLSLRCIARHKKISERDFRLQLALLIKKAWTLSSLEIKNCSDLTRASTCLDQINLPALKRLVLGKIQLSDLGQINNFLLRNPLLSELKIYSNNVFSGEAECLTTRCWNHFFLSRLSLKKQDLEMIARNSSAITRFGIFFPYRMASQDIAPTVGKMQFLTHLDVRFIAFQDNDVCQLHPLNHLQVLHVSLSRQVRGATWQTWSASLTHLKKLTLSFLEKDPENENRLLDFASHLPLLHSLGISCEISCQSALVLFSKQTCLQKLFLASIDGSPASFFLPETSFKALKKLRLGSGAGLILAAGVAWPCFTNLRYLQIPIMEKSWKQVIPLLEGLPTLCSLRIEAPRQLENGHFFPDMQEIFSYLKVCAEKRGIYLH